MQGFDDIHFGANLGFVLFCFPQPQGASINTGATPPPNLVSILGHLTFNLHYFCSYIEKQTSIHAIKTEFKRADHLTKAFTLEILENLRSLVMGW